jgi:hypothetical protein
LERPKDKSDGKDPMYLFPDLGSKRKNVFPSTLQFGRKKI